MLFEVTVGNIGLVHASDSRKEAVEAYDEYVEQSRLGYGRAANEIVTLFQDGVPEKEYTPPSDDKEETA